ncbi:alpha/beta fold hydrolase [Micromonospora coxensis]|uniref:Nucleoside-diphosphate-sugar epimerase n=1 Tax=Micromonospora coxensis TaxID=356852 RepID=A0A1C5H2D8_9ACTN|nr:alpha/beta fold hydrolase [Micromonospora coxensis]SCG40007.1 Nucleoside-diphosphate-sugar epimerase [Micromonospora coxensis]
MIRAGADRRALVFGATGFLGRWLIVELTAQGIPVTAAVRGADSADRLSGWLGRHGVTGDVASVVVDFASEDLGLAADSAALRGVTEIYNLAGAFRFGMSVDEAVRGNVASARRIVLLAARLPGSPRLVHVSGYRVSSHGARPAARSAEAYARLGAYEASKIEADGVVRTTATNLGVPVTIINPATVSGVGATGESDQLIGLAANLRELWHGRLAALPGDGDTFVPVVTVDHLARFMALVPTVPEAVGQSYWVLDDDTPPLPDLLQAVAAHYQVPVPRLRIPVRLVKRLPSRLTKADPETLSFLSSDRYPTAPAHELAAAHGLTQPETLPSILRWADHLAAHRFGRSRGGPGRGFASYAGVHTFGLGDAAGRTLVLPGLPVNADTWADTVDAMPEPARVLDLPGLGMSAGDERRWAPWLAAVTEGRDGLHLVGHSVGAAAAVEFASAHPERVDRLTLVAPAFLQPAPSLPTRLVPLTAAYLRFVTASALSRTLLGSEEFADALESSVVDLRRPGVARRIARLLARGARRRTRRALRQRLLAFTGEVHLVVGEHDPLSPEALAALGDRHRVTTIPGAGHHPQLTHPGELADAIGTTVASSLRAG